jgi:hypothetical protein
MHRDRHVGMLEIVGSGEGGCKRDAGDRSAEGLRHEESGLVWPLGGWHRGC